jgi:DNA-binding cell septation regulator SpoVG
MTTPFAKNLNDYLSNPGRRNSPIAVCDTPEALLAAGARQLPMVINPNDIDKCLGRRGAKRNKNTHGLTEEELSALPELLAEPAFIFADRERPSYIAVVSDRTDGEGRPFVIAVELEASVHNHAVNRITTMHGRERAFEPFIARNGKEVQGYVPRMIAERHLLAMDKAKATKLLRSTGLHLPEGEGFVTLNNTLPHSQTLVKGFGKENAKEGNMTYEPYVPGGVISRYSDSIRIEGHRGTWYVIDVAERSGKNIYLLEHEEYGDEAFSVIVDSKGRIILEDVSNGFDDYDEAYVAADPYNTDNIIARAHEYAAALETPGESFVGYLENTPSHTPPQRVINSDNFSEIQNYKEEQAMESYMAAESAPAESTARTAESSHGPFKFTARVTPSLKEDDKAYRAMATVTVNGQVAIHKMVVYENEKDGLSVKMPREMNKDGEWKDIVFAQNKNTKAAIFEAVKAAYMEAVALGKQEMKEHDPKYTRIDVDWVRDNTNKGSNILGDCSVIINNDIVITGVKIVKKKDGELFAALPDRMNSKGQYDDIVAPVNKEFAARLNEVVLFHFNNRGNTPYSELGGEKAFKTLNSRFAVKVGEQLNEMGVRWSAKVGDDGKTSIAVSAADGEKLSAAIETERAPDVEARKAAKEAWEAKKAEAAGSATPAEAEKITNNDNLAPAQPAADGRANIPEAPKGKGKPAPRKK